MKHNILKNFISVTISALMIITVSLTAFAGELEFILTGGLVKNYESTFDDKRIITGTAPQNTEVTITVYTNEIVIDDFGDEVSEAVVTDTYTFTVGALEAFTQTIDFEIGENYLEIYAVNGDEEICLERTINRKPIELKHELENSIVLPGHLN